MNDAKHSYRFIKDKWPNYYKSPLSDDICGFTGSEEELIHLIECLFKSANIFGMEINPSKTKIMLNDDNCQPNIVI